MAGEGWFSRRLVEGGWFSRRMEAGGWWSVRLLEPPAAGGGPTYTLTIEAGAFTVSGQAVGLLRHRRLAVEVGAFSMTGQAVTLRANRRLPVEAGAFVVNGQDVGLNYSGAPAVPADFNYPLYRRLRR